MTYKAIAIGASYGGFQGLTEILPHLPAGYPLALLIVQHLSSDSNGFLARHLNIRCALTVKEAEEKEPVLSGHVYFAPANYHLLVEEDYTLALTTSEQVNYARPSIDVLFETAAFAYREKLIGLLLTGANNDGSQGLKMIHKLGGLTIVQDPATAEAPAMPEAALRLFQPDHILKLGQIGPFLAKLIK